MPQRRNRILEFRILSLRDPEAFGEFYQSGKEEIFRFILARTSSEEVAEDLTSEVFLKACQYLFDERRTVEHLRGFLFAVARTAVVDHYRRSGGREDSLEPEDPFFRNLADTGKTVIEQTDTKLDWAVLAEHLKKLRREYSEVLVLKFMDDLSNEEIAVVLAKSTGAVRVLIHRALKSLEEIISTKEQS